MRRLLLILTLTLAVAAQAAGDREVRAAWIVTSLGLDWPQLQYEPQQQREKFATMLDRLVEANFNTVYVEMQTEGDVLWQSILEPASADVTGNGAMPLAYDVAQMMIDEAHSRGLDIYAIVRPLYLGTMGASERYRDNRIPHPLSSRPDQTIRIDNNYYLDPSDGYARDFIEDLYRELITSYAFDGLIVDSPFMPYHEPTDTETLNDVVRDIYWIIYNYRPEMKLMIATEAMPTYDLDGNAPLSPSYVSLLDEGIVDMVIPKIFERGDRGFEPALDSWTGRDHSSRTIMAVTPERLTELRSKPAPDVTDQIDLTRQSDDSIAGVAIYRASMIVDTKRPEVVDTYSRLRDEVFLQPAHLPLMPWRGVTTPGAPTAVETVRDDEGNYIITWEAPDPDAYGTPVVYYTIYAARDGYTDITDPRGEVAHRVYGNRYVYPSPTPGLEFAVTAFDAGNYESRPAFSATVSDDALNSRPYTFRYYGDVLFVGGPKTIDRLDIYNSWGNHVKHQRVNDFETSLECSDLGGGVYVVHTTYTDGATRVNKFIK